MPLRLAIFHLPGLAIFERRRLRLQIALALLRKSVIVNANDRTWAAGVETVAGAETPRPDEPLADTLGVAGALAERVGRQLDVAALGVGRAAVAEDGAELLARSALRRALLAPVIQFRSSI